MAYQCVRFNLIDSIFYTLNGKSNKKLKESTTNYVFIDAKLRKSLKATTILYQNMYNYHAVRGVVDMIYISENKAFREYYFNHCLNQRS